jgi:hypothetical protein
MLPFKLEDDNGRQLVSDETLRSGCRKSAA